MAIVYNSNPVKDGLVLHIDAANPKSYPGTGATWYDISGKGLNWTLINSPTFNASGYFRFDGTSQYAERASLFQSADNTYNTFSVWFRPVSTPAANRPVWSDASGPELGVWIDQTNSVRAYVYNGSTATTVANNTWVNVVFTYFSPAVGSGLDVQFSTYVNGVAIQQNLTNPIGAANGLNDMPVNIARDPGQPTFFSNIDVSIWQHWNRRLTNEEVKTTFEAYRGRFGV